MLPIAARINCKDSMDLRDEQQRLQLPRQPQPARKILVNEEKDRAQQLKGSQVLLVSSMGEILRNWGDSVEASGTIWRRLWKGVDEWLEKDHICHEDPALKPEDPLARWRQRKYCLHSRDWCGFSDVGGVPLKMGTSSHNNYLRRSSCKRRDLWRGRWWRRRRKQRPHPRYWWTMTLKPLPQRRPPHEPSTSWPGMEAGVGIQERIQAWLSWISWITLTHSRED